MKFSFRGYHEISDLDVCMSFNESSLQDTIEQFECFLRGCGFMFDGSLRIFEDNKE